MRQIVENRVDWFRVLVQVQRLDGNLRRMAAETGISEPQLRNYKTWSHEPAYWRGERILAYWAEVTGRDRGEAPRTNPNVRRNECPDSAGADGA